MTSKRSAKHSLRVEVDEAHRGREAFKKNRVRTEEPSRNARRNLGNPTPEKDARVRYCK
jgi:hypothetical protein